MADLLVITNDTKYLTRTKVYIDGGTEMVKLCNLIADSVVVHNAGMSTFCFVYARVMKARRGC
jgi:hypothetical protein